MRSLGALASLSLVSGAFAAPTNSSAVLPVVDLGYELYRAAAFNQTAGYYNFSNIRYAQPPTGDLRFREPQPPKTDRSVVHDGSDGRVCPQADPAWNLVAAQWLPQYLISGTLKNVSRTVSPAIISNYTLTRDPRENEDCLFLDVIVPQQVYDNAKNGTGAPVLVWIYGGGYTGGNKISGNPIELLSRGKGSYSDGAIYVAMNYRLGAFGWLAGPTFQEDGTANAALYDQRLALKWVQDNIHLFGGDKDRVTVFGESAGGGSIMHQITAWGGREAAPFQQAIPQSAGWFPSASPEKQETTFQEFLSLLNVSTLDEVRKLPSKALIAANALQVANSDYGQFTYGPQVDGNFVPADPKTLLNHGQFDQNVTLLVGHNENEGLLFAPPLTDSDGYLTFVKDLVPSAKSTIIDYIVNTLYPAVFDGSYGYRDEIQRAALTLAEAGFTCNAAALDWAFDNQTYAYLFAIPPAIHGQDVPYTYYTPGGPAAASFVPLDTNVTVAHALQDFIMTFAETGTPSSLVPGVPVFRMFGAGANVERLGVSGIKEAVDPAANERCKWWLKQLIY
ncbi:uncharacterized protein K452DRAFT_237078 [Aplosporella prunicola CBS 121167]|uniref:Carboxylic ester hydrolase n=1 Tax=Aplosporella prunicola CBS 121167 TaxID=1176127 RepID=A0A6A6AZI5_9PEZI|nr:uncharacterized protein K452DRAFT_237078 [Aplosporella prunicola CBS 121167]KAF2136678.1 hypothetical protein K452DRAFT_237078 [Aplosporella prunicola CBS 121167]